MMNSSEIHFLILRQNLLRVRKIALPPEFSGSLGNASKSASDWISGSALPPRDDGNSSLANPWPMRRPYTEFMDCLATSGFTAASVPHSLEKSNVPERSEDTMAGKRQRRVIGNVLFPWRFIGFIVLACSAANFAIPAFGWRTGIMVSFDLAALVFLISCAFLLGEEADAMRKAAERNDANRGLLLGISAVVMAVIMMAVASELRQGKSSDSLHIVLIITTLALAWLFGNMVYALHYAHMYYSRKADGSDFGGIIYPETKEPDYWDFIYFSFCLGMTFQTSDINMTSRRFRIVSTFHCLAAFVFNIGVIAFTINVLGA